MNANCGLCVSLCWGRMSIQLPDPKDAADWGWLSEHATVKTGLLQCGLWCWCLAVIMLPDLDIYLYLVLEGHALYVFWPEVSWEWGFPCSAFSVPVQPTSRTHQPEGTKSRLGSSSSEPQHCHPPFLSKKSTKRFRQVFLFKSQKSLFIYLSQNIAIG